jgi:hypothetical protein
MQFPRHGDSMTGAHRTRHCTLRVALHVGRHTVSVAMEWQRMHARHTCRRRERRRRRLRCQRRCGRGRSRRSAWRFAHTARMRIRIRIRMLARLHSLRGAGAFFLTLVLVRAFLGLDGCVPLPAACGSSRDGEQPQSEPAYLRWERPHAHPSLLPDAEPSVAPSTSAAGTGPYLPHPEQTEAQ